MAFSSKARRTIFVDGDRFFWMVRNRPTWNEVTDSNYLIPVQHENGGQLLRADIGYCRSEFVDRTNPSITPSIVGRIIRFAIVSGWEFEAESFTPLELNCTQILSETNSSCEDFTSATKTSEQGGASNTDPQVW